MKFIPSAGKKQIKFWGKVGILFFFITTPLYAFPLFPHASMFKAGVKIITLLDEKSDQSYNLAIWYPARRPENTFQDGNWALMGAKNAKMASGKFPLVILSHGSVGSKHSLHDLSASLARYGCIVLCLLHAGDNWKDATHTFTKNFLAQRTWQLQNALRLFLKSQDWKEQTDQTRIALIGTGTGAPTVLGLAGVPFVETGYTTYCDQIKQRDAYCSPWIYSRMTKGAWHPLPLTDAIKPKAIVLIAPLFGMMLDMSQKISCPVLILDAGRQQDASAKRQEDFFFSLSASPAIRQTCQNFTANDFLAPCPDTFEEATSMCSRHAGISESERKSVFLNRIIDFLIKSLSLKNLSSS